MTPLISIVIPIYQVEKYLKQCLDSVIVQSYYNLEIILVNDGSTDGSGKICDEYARKDGRIKVIHKMNGGLSSARNVGIDNAKGEYIAFIDSDDWVDSRYVETLYNICREKGCDIAQCVHWDIWSEANYYVDRITEPFVFSAREAAYAYDTIELWQSVLAWNKLYKTKLFDGIRYPEGRLHEDEFISYKLIWKAEKIAVTYTKLYYYRRCRENSIKTQKYSYRRLDCDDAYIEKTNFYEEKNEHELAVLTQKRHYKWLQQQIQLINQSDLVDKAEVIHVLSQRISDIENTLVEEKMEYKKSAFHGYLFPFGVVPVNSRIILYGAGNVGKQFFRQITVTNYCNVVAWIDKNSEKCKEKGLPTFSVQHIYELSGKYDYVVIAIENKLMSNEVITELQELYNIDKAKIIYQLDYF